MPNSRTLRNFASVENMRRMEQENAGKLAANTRLKPGNANDPRASRCAAARLAAGVTM